MELLRSLYEIASPSANEHAMIRFIVSELEKIPNIKYCVDRHRNIYAVKGNSDTYPCIVSHTDEVHWRKKGYEVITLKDNIICGYNNLTHDFAGIGADDKNGIWICLKCLEKYDTLKCVFFADEERGGIGSGNAFMKFFNDCRFVIECDRRGNKDIIISADGVRLCSEEFIKAIRGKRFRYRRAAGMLTDVLVLKQKRLKVSCINLSCGYYNPHTNHEITDFSDLKNCLDFVCHIIEECTDVYKHSYVKSKKNHTYDYYNPRFDDQPLITHYFPYRF